jgi:3-hydroxybutyryl-CoA dehydratase
VSIEVGTRFQREFPVDDATIERFGAASGDRNPVHFDAAYAAATRFGGRIAHGMLTASFLSAILGNDLPGPGTIYLGQTLRFLAPVRPGDRVRCEVEVTAFEPRRRRAVLATRAWVGETQVVDGEATVIAPETAGA